MNKFDLIVNICVMLTVSLPQTWSRKYNIEAESLRLYGEDLHSVLRKFRRTPEYLQLLEEKNEHIQLLFDEVALNAQQYVVENRLKKKIALVCGLDDQFDHLEQNSPEVRFSYLKSSYGRRDGEEPQMQENLTTTTLTPIDILDQYAIFTSPLTTKEKNKIKDIGFETAGETIHMIIRGMGPLEFRSTRQPYGGDLEQHTRTTTERDHRHLISTKAPPFDIEDQTHKTPEKFDSPMDDTLRAFKNKIRLGPF